MVEKAWFAVNHAVTTPLPPNTFALKAIFFLSLPLFFTIFSKRRANWMSRLNRHAASLIGPKCSSTFIPVENRPSSSQIIPHGCVNVSFASFFLPHIVACTKRKARETETVARVIIIPRGVKRLAVTVRVAIKRILSL